MAQIKQYSKLSIFAYAWIDIWIIHGIVMIIQSSYWWFQSIQPTAPNRLHAIDCRPTLYTQPTTHQSMAHNRLHTKRLCNKTFMQQHMPKPVSGGPFARICFWKFEMLKYVSHIWENGDLHFESSNIWTFKCWNYELWLSNKCIIYKKNFGMLKVGKWFC